MGGSGLSITNLGMRWKLVKQGDGKWGFFTLFSPFCICLKFSRVKRKKKKKTAGISFCQLKETVWSQEILIKGDAHTLRVTYS